MNIKITKKLIMAYIKKWRKTITLFFLVGLFSDFIIMAIVKYVASLYNKASPDGKLNAIVVLGAALIAAVTTILNALIKKLS
jgi:Na+/melibiose symporter-like transporter